jgi:hypothetical protein
MNAVETIQTAIDKLTALKSKSTQPTDGTNWVRGRDEKRYESSRDVYTGPNEDTAGSADIIFGIDPVDASLIVTLHRTIDAQLDFLRTARGFYGAGISGPDVANLFAEHALALARAITGGA